MGAMKFRAKGAGSGTARPRSPQVAGRSAARVADPRHTPHDPKIRQARPVQGIFVNGLALDTRDSRDGHPDRAASSWARGATRRQPHPSQARPRKVHPQQLEAVQALRMDMHLRTQGGRQDT
jgi:hypothetical protein